MADAKDAANVEAGGGMGNKIVMGLLVLNVVVMVGVLVVLYLGNKRQQAQQTIDQVAAGANAPAAGGEAKTAADKGKPGEMGILSKSESDVRFFAVGDFTANLNGPASTHYVKVNVNFEITKEADDEEMKTRRPQFRDKVIALLNAKKPADLQTADGRNNLKEEIKTAVNTFIQKGKVEGVYFSTFIIN